MRALIQAIISAIKKQIVAGTANLIKLENFESPIIYQQICDYFSGVSMIEQKGKQIQIDCFQALMDVRKFRHFQNEANKNDYLWTAALEYLQDNEYYNEMMPLTSMRNKAAEMTGKTTVFLLMGAEDAEDKGSLADFNHISSDDLIAAVKKDYSAWFKSTLTAFDEDKPDYCNALNNIFKAIFKWQNLDIMKFSRFVDAVNRQTFEDFREMVSYIFETLKDYWEIPSILTSVPNVSSMKGNKSVAIIENDYLFIHNLISLPSAKLKKINDLLEQYAEKEELDRTASIGPFSDFEDFGKHLTDFLHKRDMDTNRRLFMQMDFGIISKILKLKVPSDTKPPKDSVIKLSGDPLIVYLKMISHTLQEFQKEYENEFPIELIFSVKQIALSNCILDEDEQAQDTLIEQYRNICHYLGGILQFIKQRGFDGQNISIKYENEQDPFNFQNAEVLKSRFKEISKWGENSRISFEVTAVGEADTIKKCVKYQWFFSPYAGWKNAFSLFVKAYEANDDEYEIPYIIQCANMQDYLGCETEEEFNIKLETMQCTSISKKYERELRQTFSGTQIYDKWNGFVERFTDWCKEISSSGFFYCIDQMNAMIGDYCNLLELVRTTHDSLTENKKEKLMLFLHCMSIVSEHDYLSSLKSDAVIVPAYHPAMLEKLNARNDYLIYSFKDLMSESERINSMDCNKVIDKMDALSAITQAMDVIPDGTCDYLLCRNVWGYYAVYCNQNISLDYISNIESIRDEYEETELPKGADTPQSRIVAHHILDFVKTFPACADGLKICFIAPVEIQDIVAGLGLAAEKLDASGIEAVFNVRFICLGGSKNVGGYLRYWLDHYAAKQKGVQIHSYLKYLQESDIRSDIEKLLADQDVCFIYDILKTNQISFDGYHLDLKQQQQNMTSCQFPMAFVPDTLSSTHSRKRKVNISQVQFLVSDAYTQTTYKVSQPNAVSDKYKVMQVLTLEDTQNELLNAAHANCRWVVCIDRAIDRELLQEQGNRIIGFTTGEGCFGEYNVTVSAKEAILKDIKNLLKVRLVQKFTDWKTERAEWAADECISMTRCFDGSRILKALNPYDYEIHNFLAYVLTVKALKISEKIPEGLLSQTLLNLDSYQHWMESADKRPDYMLIEVPDIPINRDANAPLHIRIKIIECKMSLSIESAIEKAIEQVQSGVDTLSALWNPNNQKVDRRYWYTQLYRAIAFAKLGISDNDPDYAIIHSKIYDILNGNFCIEWTGDIHAYDLNSESADCVEEKLETESDLSHITLHRAGQIYIQKTLLPDSCNGDDFVYHNLIEIQEEAEDQEEAEFEEETVLDFDIPEVTDDVQIPVSVDEMIPDRQTVEEIPELAIPETEAAAESAVETVDEEQPVVMPEIKPETEDSNTKISLSDIRVLLGEDQKTHVKYYWEFGNKMLNNRHLLINGNSGYGKTYCIQALLMELSLQGVPSVIFDYTGGFAPDKLDPVFRAALGSRIEQRIVKLSKIPINPFSRGQITLMEGVVIPEENVDIANKISNVLTAAYKFGEQQRATVYSAIMQGLEKYNEQMDFDHLYEIVREIDNAQSESILNKMRPFIDLKPFAADDNFSWSTIKNSEGMVYIVQLIGYDRPTQLMLTELLLWDLWNFAQSNGKESEPLVVVLDEAQNLNHQSSSPSGKILTEGRKFGISGWYATQFMKGQLSEEEIQCLQQASQKLYFCPPENGVVEVAKSIDITAAGAKEWAEKVKKLKKGECVTCGSMLRGEMWTKYPPRIIKVTSLQERINHESLDGNQT